MPHQVGTTTSHQALNGGFDSNSHVNVHPNGVASRLKWKKHYKTKWIYASMVILSSILTIVLVTLLIVKTDSRNQTLPPCLTPTCVREAARILKSIDESVSPCDDFYQFACGKWIESAVIPEHKSSVSSFEEVQDDLNKRLRVLIEKPSQPSELDFVVKAKNLYKSCMNLTQIEKADDQPLRDILALLGGWPVLESRSSDRVQFDWQQTYYKLRELGLSGHMLVSIFVHSDEKNNSKRIIYLDQASLGLFDRDLLLKGVEDPSVAAYFKLMVESAVLLGADKSEAEKQMQEVLEFETRLANNSVPKEELRNMSLLYNKMTIEELVKFAPNTDWLKLINKLTMQNIEPTEEVVLIVPSFIRWLDLILPQTKARVLANYMLWRVVYSKTSYLSKKWRQLDQDFELMVYGKQRPEPRWEQCIDEVQGSMGKAISNLYVRNHFAEDNKKLMSQLVANINKEFLKVLDEIDWMKDETLKHAKKKANAIRLKIGYPDELLDDSILSNHYKNLNIDHNDYFKNAMNIDKWSADFSFRQLREPNDKNDWRKFADVAVVNAYYFPQENTIVFPAGILQGIFYEKNRPNYLNYGAIGEVAGHEVTHGFDDTGRQYNQEGDVHNWWDSETDSLFKKKSQCIVDQYSSYKVPVVGLNLNGINTQGENIADNGGIKQAFRAYRQLVARHGAEQPLPGLKYTSEQLFWISYGVQSCSKEMKEILKLMVEVDAHCPSRYRVIGVVSNSKEFSDTFNCPVGSKMNPVKKCNVW